MRDEAVPVVPAVPSRMLAVLSPWALTVVASRALTLLPSRTLAVLSRGSLPLLTVGPLSPVMPMMPGSMSRHVFSSHPSQDASPAGKEPGQRVSRAFKTCPIIRAARRRTRSASTGR